MAKIIDQHRRRIEEGAVVVQYVYARPVPIPDLVTRSPLHRAAERY